MRAGAPRGLWAGGAAAPRRRRLAPAALALWAAALLPAALPAAMPPAHAQDAGGGPSPSDTALIFAASIAAVVGIALYVSREAIVRRKTAYDAGTYESQRDRDYEKYHSEWGDDFAAGRGGDADCGGGGPDGGGGGGGGPDAGGGRPAGPPADHYGALGLDGSATQGEIKRRYRELAKRLHPDRAGPGGPGAGGAMAAINEAYYTLSDPERRRQYDLFLGRRAGRGSRPAR